MPKKINIASQSIMEKKKRCTEIIKRRGGKKEQKTDRANRKQIARS